MSAANSATTMSPQPVLKLVAYDDAEPLLDNLNPDRHLPNQSPPLSDRSPTPRGVTAPLDNNNASSIEQALSHLAVGSTEGALSCSSCDADSGTSSAHDDSGPVEPLSSLSEVVDWMCSCAFLVPPKIEAMLQDPDAFDQNGKSIATYAPPERITDQARLQFIQEQESMLKDIMDWLPEIFGASTFADPMPDSEVAARPVLTPAEALRRARSGGADEVLRTRYGRGLVAFAIALECLQLSYMLWRERRVIEVQ